MRNGLVDLKKLLPPLHTKRPVMAQFAKALDKNSVSNIFALFEANLKEDIFIGLHIRTLFKDKDLKTL